MKINRIRKIQEMLNERHSITIECLCTEFNVSKNTIRRDIAELNKLGCIKKVYGGIVKNEQNTTTNEKVPEATSWASYDPHLPEKLKIAEMASKLVQDDDVIFIDTGTTTALLLDFIKDKKNITIVTASIHAINVAIQYDKFNLIATGGTLYPPTKAFVGPEVTGYLKKYNISKFFLSTTGISIENGVTSASPLDCEIQQLLLAKPGKNILMVDSSKLDAPSLVSFGQLKDMDYIIIDKEPPASYVEHLKAENVQLIFS